MLRFLKVLLALGLLGGLSGLCAAVLGVSILYPKLPTLDILDDYRPRLPLRVYNADGELIGEFGEEKRTLAGIDDVPPMLVTALLATEDARFFEHDGIDWIGIARAVRSIAQGKREGASTITMQVARNFFLKRDQTVLRKVVEMLLALKIERQFSKERILEFYINQIYLGRGSYGFAAAADIYYGKDMSELSLAEVSLLAGLPKAPSTYNPTINPSLAKKRQMHVLNRMLAVGAITRDEYEMAALADLPPVVSKLAAEEAVVASYVAEHVRKLVFGRFGDETYERGFRVHTTVDGRMQRAAIAAVRKGLLDYERRHRYRGPERYVDIAGRDDRDLLEILREEQVVGGLLPAIVVEKAEEGGLVVLSKDGARRTIGKEGLEFAESADKETVPPLSPGALVRIVQEEGEWSVIQLPQAQGALIALDPDTGRVLALVGGFDFFANQFNNVFQARRQPGSVMKPFIYSASLERGFTPSTLLYDSPIYLTTAETGSGEEWSPKNYDGKYAGTLRLREALAKSKNLATIRVLRQIGPEYAQDFLSRFGFSKDDHPPYLTLALGAGLTTPADLAAGYAVFANGGFLVDPFVVERIEDFDGNVVERDFKRSAQRRVIDERNAFIMTSILRSVISAGTGARARSLGRADLAGKTGTTNDTIDAWFAGYGPGVVAVSWVGYSTPRSLGRRETGARAALPIWMDFMRAALKDVPDYQPSLPDGVVRAAVDPETGLLASQSPFRFGGDMVWDYFYRENLPAELTGEGLPTFSAEEREELL